jgi:hypothetical protein
VQSYGQVAIFCAKTKEVTVYQYKFGGEERVLCAVRAALKDENYYETLDIEETYDEALQRCTLQEVALVRCVGQPATCNARDTPTTLTTSVRGPAISCAASWRRSTSDASPSSGSKPDTRSNTYPPRTTSLRLISFGRINRMRQSRAQRGARPCRSPQGGGRSETYLKTSCCCCGGCC